MGYESLLFECYNEGINVKEKPLQANNGLCKGNKIAIKNTLSTKEKYCTLSEELGHYKLTVGNITNLKDINNMKQELKARRWGYNKTVNLEGIIEAFEHNCIHDYEIAEYLEVTTKYFRECI
ncbi:MAG: ImmA/IrrE family metallo-endopeptidase, partial [Clostridiales bacterium]|nr:ImmA/IrrE family metallo-endopeptidase [Clostridiales bacterium]